MELDTQEMSSRRHFLASQGMNVGAIALAWLLQRDGVALGADPRKPTLERPVYDLKPYLPWCEAQPDARADWAQLAPFACAPEAIVIPVAFAEKLGDVTTALVRQILRLDLQPAYHDETNRTYGMTLSGWNIRWRAGPDETLEVCAVDRV